ncbi:Lrp/AsnC family transcriptional regulator [Saccharopolyspora sp. NPDC050389]|uniref:Lrp/AsnC family transcriptional regulator n=1 Tax=Saccharopolyspora sp. NPDC050389 TaxID=3155516 RepID=UPI0034104DFA
MKSADLDEVDRRLVHALQIDGRAPFSRIAEVLDVSEQTAARRYRRLRTAGVLRVVGGVDGSRLGYVSWTIRLRCTPDAANPIAAALSRRPDTFWVHILSGGTEISCFTQARTDDESDALLLEKLPRTSRVLGIAAHSMLQGFTTPSGWPGLARLTTQQVERLRPELPPPDDGPVVLDAGDEALLRGLARDGRMGYGELAADTGWSESTVRRRIDHLRRAGVLRYQVEISPGALGFHAEARLWISVRPSALVPVANELSSHPEVNFAAATTGPTNLMAAVTCRNTRDLYRYLTERVGSLEAVHTLETAPVMRTVKRTGTVLLLRPDE